MNQRHWVPRYRNGRGKFGCGRTSLSRTTSPMRTLRTLISGRSSHTMLVSTVTSRAWARLSIWILPESKAAAHSSDSVIDLGPVFSPSPVNHSLLIWARKVTIHLWCVVETGTAKVCTSVIREICACCLVVMAWRTKHCAETELAKAMPKITVATRCMMISGSKDCFSNGCSTADKAV